MERAIQIIIHFSKQPLIQGDREDRHIVRRRHETCHRQIEPAPRHGTGLRITGNTLKDDSMTTEKPTTYKTNPVVSCRIESDEDAILFNPDTDNTCVLNSTGIAIWQFIGSPRSEEEICAHLSAQYDEAPDRESLLADIQAFIKRLGDDYLCREPTDGS